MSLEGCQHGPTALGFGPKCDECKKIYDEFSGPRYGSGPTSEQRLQQERTRECRHCGEPLALKSAQHLYWTHAHGLYRCQQKVTYGHNAAHPDVPCEPGGPNPCACTYLGGS